MGRLFHVRHRGNIRRDRDFHLFVIRIASPEPTYFRAQSR
jgi:hypothetical protein